MDSRSRLRYPSDLSDSQWSRLEPLLPEPRVVGRHRSVPQREIANAINYRWETGCVWRMLPHDFPPWGTVYAYFRHWQRTGVIRLMRDILLEPRPKSPPRMTRSAQQRNPADVEADRAAPSSHAPAVRRDSSEHGFSSPDPNRNRQQPFAENDPYETTER